MMYFMEVVGFSIMVDVKEMQTTLIHSQIVLKLAVSIMIITN